MQAEVNEYHAPRQTIDDAQRQNDMDLKNKEDKPQALDCTNNEPV